MGTARPSSLRVCGFPVRHGLAPAKRGTMGLRPPTCLGFRRVIALACAGLVVQLWVGKPTPPPLLRTVQFRPGGGNRAQPLSKRSGRIVGTKGLRHGWVPQGGRRNARTNGHQQGTRNPQAWDQVEQPPLAANQMGGVPGNIPECVTCFRWRYGAFDQSAFGSHQRQTGGKQNRRGASWNHRPIPKGPCKWNRRKLARSYVR